MGVCRDFDESPSRRGTHVCATMPPRNLPIAEDIHAIAYCETCNCNIAGDVTQCCCLSMTAQMRHYKLVSRDPRATLENIGKGSPRNTAYIYSIVNDIYVHVSAQISSKSINIYLICVFVRCHICLICVSIHCGVEAMDQVGTKVRPPPTVQQTIPGICQHVNFLKST